MATKQETDKKKAPAKSAAKKASPDKGAPKQAASKKAVPKKAVDAKAAPAKKKAAPKAKKSYAPRLKVAYAEKILPELMKAQNYANIHQVPTLDKIVLNVGLGNAREDANMLKGALEDLAVITGQKPVVTYAKKPISNFKIRQGDPVGAKVTLRHDRMYEFFDRLMSLAVPRIRDFRGLPNRSFDGRGNYTFGITEQIIFPEIDYDKIDRIRGMDITLVTTAKTDEEAYVLLSAFGFPFRPKPQVTEGVAA